MNKFYWLALVVVVLTAGFSSTAAGQSDPEISQLPGKPDPHLEKRVPAGWLALSLVGQAAAFADVRTTLTLRNGNPNFTDQDPFAQHVVNLPTPAYIAVAAAFTSSISVVSFEMRKSPRRWERRMWWIPQTIQIGINIGCSLHNEGEPRWTAPTQKRTR